MKALVGAAALAALSCAVSAQELPDQYPPGKGRDDAFYACAGCHAFKVVAERKLDRAGWAAMIERMNKEFGAPKLGYDERMLILDYLAAAFSPR